MMEWFASQAGHRGYDREFNYDGEFDYDDHGSYDYDDVHASGVIPGFGHAHASSGDSAVREFRELVMEQVRACAPGETFSASALGSLIPRSQRPDPDGTLLDQVEDYVPEAVVERGGRGGGCIASATDNVAVFAIRVREALREAGGELAGGMLGSRVHYRISGARLSDQVEDHVNGVAVTRGAGGWSARLLE